MARRVPFLAFDRNHASWSFPFLRYLDIPELQYNSGGAAMHSPSSRVAHSLKSSAGETAIWMFQKTTGLILLEQIGCMQWKT